MRKTVVVAMSGGVDSSTAAALLKEEGFSPIGVTMELWQDGSVCCSSEDVYDAKKVAAMLDIPHYVLNFRKEFQRAVLAPSVREYTEGRTPNPCVLCNERLKFGLLSRRARQFGAHHLATGHYARIEYDDSRKRFILKKGDDPDKEQSYWLATLRQQQLAFTLLPLASHSKKKTRRFASKFGLKVAQKKESQDICWIGNFQDVLSKFTQPRPGSIVDLKGHLIGEHRGIQFYTVGQRRGLGIAASRPLYVLRIEKETNRVVVGYESDLYHDGFVGLNPNWVSIEEPDTELEVEVKIRYRGVSAKAVISNDGCNVIVRFAQPQRAITPGQLAVFYRGDEVLGAAWIDRIMK